LLLCEDHHHVASLSAAMYLGDREQQIGK